MEKLQTSLHLLFKHIKNNEITFSLNQIYKYFKIPIKSIDTKSIFNNLYVYDLHSDKDINNLLPKKNGYLCDLNAPIMYYKNIDKLVQVDVTINQHIENYSEKYLTNIEIGQRIIENPAFVFLLLEFFNYGQILNYIKYTSRTLQLTIFNPLGISSFEFGNCMVCMSSLINNHTHYVCTNIHCNKYLSDYLSLITNNCNKYLLNDLTKIIMSYNNLYHPFYIHTKPELTEIYELFWTYILHRLFYI